MRAAERLRRKYVKNYRGHYKKAVREYYGNLLTRLEEYGICDTCRACPMKCKVPGFDHGVFQCFTRPSAGAEKVLKSA